MKKRLDTLALRFAMNALEKVRSIIKELRAGTSEPKASENWALLGRLMSRMTNDRAAVERVTTAKDPDAAESLLRTIEGRAAAADSFTPASFTNDQLDHALRAFMKRLKVTRLDDQSKMTTHPMTDGKPSSIDAIRPPDGFPNGIWSALAKAGKLKDMGGGFYMEG